MSTLSPPTRTALVPLAFALTLGVGFSSAQDLRFRDGRFVETLGGVTLQRADEAGSDEAVRNMPFLPGDRVWTDERGRAEIAFADGEVLWIAERSKVDSLGRGGRDQDERLGLRTFAGSFGGRVRHGGPGFEFHAPGGTITTTGAAAFRVDVRAGETMVSVSEGELLADLSGQRMTVRTGERVRYAERAVDGPYRFQRAAADGFDRWCDERTENLKSMARNRNHDRLPDELDAYGDELDGNGEWVYDEPQGYVYVPRVAYDWAPYTYGRWAYTLYGWTWVADEPWGFVTSHYGRWGYSSRIGWHWLPRSGFAGAWVSWSTPAGGWSHTIGWCALGSNDRPVGSFYETGGRAVARGDARGVSSGRGWSFANRSDMSRASIQRRRVDLPADEAQRAVVWNPGATPNREFRESRRETEGRGRGSSASEATGAISRDSRRSIGENGAEPRVYVRPWPGDSTPELRSDPTTTIPNPEARRRRTIGQDGFKEEEDNRRSRARPDDSTPPPENKRERPTRDPLLSRLFRSITSVNSERETKRDSDRASDQDRGDDPSARRRDAAPREEPKAREATPREKTRPAEARPEDENRGRDQDRDRERDRGRPAGAERPPPRNPPPPQASPRGGGSGDGRATKRRPESDR